MSDLGSPNTAEAAEEVTDFCSRPPEQMFKVVVVGDSFVGKSSFIRSLSNGTITALQAGSVDFLTKDVSIDEMKIRLRIWDTFGLLKRYLRIIQQLYLSKADGVILMYDCTEEKSFTNIRLWMNGVREAVSSGIPMMLVGNKVDLSASAISRGITVISREDGEKMAEEIKASFTEISAKDGANIDDALVSLTRSMVARSLLPKCEDVQRTQTAVKSKCVIN